MSDHQCLWSWNVSAADADAGAVVAVAAAAVGDDNNLHPREKKRNEH